MGWINDLFQQLLDAIIALFMSLVEIFKDIVYWFFNLIMNVVDDLLAVAISLFEPIDIGQYMSGFPPEAAWVLAQIGIPQALGMIVSSIGIRIILQLIPFTRLGS
ncbi:VSK receptor [Vibrio tubiashii]|nr:VSK receptor [Vibrio tubiashii]